MDSNTPIWSYLNTDAEQSPFDSSSPFSTPSLADPFMSYDYASFPLPIDSGDSDLASRKACAPKDVSPGPIRTISPQPKIKTPEISSLSFADLESAITSGPVDRDVSGAAERLIIKEDPQKYATNIFPSSGDSDLRDRVHEVFRSDWWSMNEKEPHGVLHCFVERQGPKAFKCKCCTKKLSRVDRAIDHFRTHIHHRPYKCIGSPGCGDVLCKHAFFTRDCLKSHCSKHERICERCGTKLEDKNLLRHQTTRKCRRYSIY